MKFNKLTAYSILGGIDSYIINSISDVQNKDLGSNKIIFKALDTEYFYYYNGKTIKQILANTLEEAFDIVWKETSIQN